MKKNYQSYWNKICIIHGYTKHYQLIAEELHIGDMFLQSLKEHRDAYDHIVRIFSIPILEEPPKDPDAYIRTNFQDAISHEYRAFCDTADWLSVICRNAIRLILSQFKLDEIKEKYPNYAEIDPKIIDFSIRVAAEREHKDIAGNLIDKVENYSKLLDEIIEYYKKIASAFPHVDIGEVSIVNNGGNG